MEYIMEDTMQAKVVRGTDGRISQKDTLAQFHNDLSSLLSQENANHDQIVDAVQAVWDGNENLKSISLDALASDVFNRLEFKASEFKTQTERIKTYVRAAQDVFVVGKGSGGGVRLLSRMTAEERTKALETRDKARTKAEAKAAAKKKVA
jgi:hypothetical protein